MIFSIKNIQCGFNRDLTGSFSTNRVNDTPIGRTFSMMLCLVLK